MQIRLTILQKFYWRFTQHASCSFNIGSQSSTSSSAEVISLGGSKTGGDTIAHAMKVITLTHRRATGNSLLK